MTAESYNARVVARRDLHESLTILRVGPADASRGEVPRFEPGQFSNLGLFEDGPESGRGSGSSAPQLLRRAFSIASPARERTYFEFYIQRVDQGAFTTKLWQLRTGDALWLDPQVYGQFTLAEVPPESDIVFVATGTGVGPFLSMLREYHGRGRWHSAAVIHSARTRADLGYHDELTELAARDRAFRYVPTLTREPATHEPGGSPWQGLRERLQHLFEPARFRELFGRELSPVNLKLFLCGNPEMIVQLSAQLAPLGLSRHSRRAPGHIHTERYW